MERTAGVVGARVGAGLLSAALFGASTPLSKALPTALPAT